jgi:RimJ/RimL family protein N-acetyltransferase
MTKLDAPAELRTKRLILRRWRPGDVEPYVSMNADPHVMRFFPALLSREESETSYRKLAELIDMQGFGLWAAEIQASGDFIGFIGLHCPTFEAPFTPCVEIGWRLRKEYWGQGYAPEGAQEALRDGFERVGLDEIVSMTTTNNEPSMRVMEKIGMVRNIKDDFDHPRVPEGPLKRHVLYRLTRSRWQELRGTQS